MLGLILRQRQKCEYSAKPNHTDGGIKGGIPGKKNREISINILIQIPERILGGILGQTLGRTLATIPRIYAKVPEGIAARTSGGI